jgi:large subunit ribosomal protein L3
MGTRKAPRKGSLQFWPRKRARKILPRVNWSAVGSDNSKNLLGFICYKAGMMSAIATDNTEDSMTMGKKIPVPVTILACPHMKIFSVRFYNGGKVAGEIISSSLNKELKSKLKIPKQTKTPSFDDLKIEYDDVRVITYSEVKTTGLKKTPDMIELDLKGSKDEKLAWAKENIDKEVSVLDVFETNGLVDVRGLTKGKGFSGPVKRFGIKLRFHKSEKGRRKVGSIAPWHPSRTTFRTPAAGQMGNYSRVTYNNKIMDIQKAGEKVLKNIKNFGEIKTDYLIVRGSVQGPAKRQLLLTYALRPNKKQTKKSFAIEGLK